MEYSRHANIDVSRDYTQLPPPLIGAYAKSDISKVTTLGNQWIAFCCCSLSTMELWCVPCSNVLHCCRLHMVVRVCFGLVISIPFHVSDLFANLRSGSLGSSYLASSRSLDWIPEVVDSHHFFWVPLVYCIFFRHWYHIHCIICIKPDALLTKSRLYHTTSSVTLTVPLIQGCQTYGPQAKTSSLGCSNLAYFMKLKIKKNGQTLHFHDV